MLYSYASVGQTTYSFESSTQNCSGVYVGITRSEERNSRSNGVYYATQVDMEYDHREVVTAQIHMTNTNDKRVD